MGGVLYGQLVEVGCEGQGHVGRRRLGVAEIPTSAGASTRATSQPPPAKAKRIETTAGHDTTDQAGQPTIIAALDSAATGLTSGQDAFARLPECADSIGPHGAVFRVGCAPEGREAGILVISIANAASLSERLLSPSTRPSPILTVSSSTSLPPSPNQIGRAHV